MVLRISTQTTLLRRFIISRPCFPSSVASVHHHRRHRSSHSGRGHLIEVDLQAVTSSDGDAEVMGVKKLEEMIHRITVLKSTPDWLPFLPGSSFWVPPRVGSRSPSDIAQMLVKMTNHSHNTLSNDESLSLTTFQGWPSSSFFQGGDIRHLSNLDMEEEEEEEDEDEDVELMFAAEEAEAIAEAEVEAEAIAEAEAEAEAETIAEAEAEAEAEAIAAAEAKAEAEAEVEACVTIESKAQVPTHSGKKSQFENEEG